MQKQYVVSLAAAAIGLSLVAAFQNCSSRIQPMDQSSGGTNAEVKDLCKVTATLPEFQIGAGAQTFDSNGAGAVKIVNRTTKTFSLTSVAMQPKTSPAGRWGEYCVYKTEFTTYADPADGGALHPGQSAPGVGEVSCVHKQTADVEYPRHVFPNVGDSAGLPLRPGECLVINGYTQDGRGGSIVDNVYQVSAVDGGGSLTILRQPIFDQVFSGNGVRQYTNYLPVVNRTGRDQYFHGALIYVATDQGVQPAKQDEALDDNCIYILSVAGAIRKSYCRTEYATLRSGILLTTPERLAPEEAIVAQMAYVAPNSAAWGGVNFLLLTSF